MFKRQGEWVVSIGALGEVNGESTLRILSVSSSSLGATCKHRGSRGFLTKF